MIETRYTKSERMLYLLAKLNSGKSLKKKELAQEFQVDLRTIQRDIAGLNNYLIQIDPYRAQHIAYNGKTKGYELREKNEVALTSGEIFALVKILLESRALVKEEMDGIINKLVAYSERQGQEEIKQHILNEQFHYSPLQHQQPLINCLLDMVQCIKAQKKLKIAYIRQDGKAVERIICPLSILFSEYYFYIATYQKEGDTMPIMYRLDRIQNYEILEEGYRIINSTRFEEGEFKKRIQFMYPGKLMRVTLRFWGASLEALMDRLPTAEVIKKEGDHTFVKAEVYGSGIKMWLLSQADRIEVLEPQSLRDEMKETIEKMKAIYQ